MIFVGGCSLVAARHVLGADLSTNATIPAGESDVLDPMESLVSKSLLQRSDPGDGEPRFGMLETIREFGLEKLAARGELEAIQRWHAEYFAALVEEAEAKLDGHERRVWLEWLEVELDNLRSALSWCMTHDAEIGLTLGASLHLFWVFQGQLFEGRRWLEELLPITATGTLRRARALLRESLAIHAKAGTRFLTAVAIVLRGMIAIEEGLAYQGTRLIGTYESLSPRTQGGLDPDERANRDQCLASARARLGDTAFAQAWAEGQAMTLE